MTTEYQTAVEKVYNIFEDFTYDGITLNIVKILDAIWVKAKDITSILKYNDTKQPIRIHVDDDDKTKLGDLWGVFNTPHDFDRQNQDQTIYINESGLYSLIMASKLPEAKVFKKWITSEVIPSIRKTGKYENEELIRKLTQKDKVIVEKECKITQLIAKLDIQNVKMDAQTAKLNELLEINLNQSEELADINGRLLKVVEHVVPPAIDYTYKINIK